MWAALVPARALGPTQLALTQVGKRSQVAQAWNSGTAAASMANAKINREGSRKQPIALGKRRQARSRTHGQVANNAANNKKATEKKLHSAKPTAK